jgi:FkbM family methyltransferase
MTSAVQKISWRAELLLGKLGGRCPNISWPLLWQWLGQRHNGGEEQVRVREQDAAASMVLLEIGQHSFWFPQDANRDLLGIGYPEVFDPTHPHHYEGGGARLREGDVVIDAGACEGYFVRFALDRGAKVIAVEPWSRMAGCLERTFAKEVKEGRLQVVRAFLGATPDTLELRINLDHPFSSNATDQTERARMDVEQVPVRTIDEVVEASGWGRLDFVKMDIEGAERDALAGATRVFAKDKPRVSITTYHRPDDWKVLSRQIRSNAAAYVFTYKGVIYYPGGHRPMMMHGWPAA